MFFIYKKWSEFCKQLNSKGINSIPAKDVKGDNFFVLKHDVEANVKKAVKLAKIEYKYNHRGSYYIQAYLLKKTSNIRFLKQIQDFGHEVSYHYDVMDSNKGDIDKALVEFENNINLFDSNGFKIKTVCQHGNPLIERVGYNSNRDFFRSEKIKNVFPKIADIMVNYKEKYNVDYKYYSDAGRKFKLIYDPINNDITVSGDKDIIYNNLTELLNVISTDNNAIISTHPHRWENCGFVYGFKLVLFKIIRAIAKILFKIPFFRKLMSKYYYLAKKI